MNMAMSQGSKVVTGVITAAVIGFGALVFNNSREIGELRTDQRVTQTQYTEIIRRLDKIETAIDEGPVVRMRDPRVDQIAEDVERVYQYLRVQPNQ